MRPCLKIINYKKKERKRRYNADWSGRLHPEIPALSSGHLELESSYLKPKLSDTFPPVGKYSFAEVGRRETADELEPSGLGGW